MFVEELLRKAKEGLAKREIIAVNRYIDLVEKLAEGETIEPDGVLDILSEADLQHDIDAFGTRDELDRLKELTAQFKDRKRGLTDEILELQDQIDDLKVNLKKSQEELRVVTSCISNNANRRQELLRDFV